MKASVHAGLVLAALLAQHSLAAPKSELWPYWQSDNAGSDVTVDHQIWQKLLSRFVVSGNDKINRVAYQDFDDAAKTQLRRYLNTLSKIAPTRLNRKEQLAYWINLYNAQTVQVVLDHPMKKSILSMGPFLSLGPWDEPYLNIEGKPVTLNDIEHRILRPIWQDHRLHYVLNCASLGCPNLNREAYSAATIERQLAQAEREFLQHPRAISLTQRGKLQLTSLFDWYLKDFANSKNQLLTYLARQRPDLAPAIKGFADAKSPAIDYVYDWDLNVID